MEKLREILVAGADITLNNYFKALMENTNVLLKEYETKVALPFSKKAIDKNEAYKRTREILKRYNSTDNENLKTFKGARKKMFDIFVSTIENEPEMPEMVEAEEKDEAERDRHYA